MLHEKLTYEIRGACISVYQVLGNNHKETVYHRALKEELNQKGLNFVHEPHIDIYYPKTGKKIGSYQPDFLVEDKVLLEIKAHFPLPASFQSQVYDYVKNSSYELILFVNFGGPKLYIKRFIYTNDRKPFISVSHP